MAGRATADGVARAAARFAIAAGDPERDRDDVLALASYLPHPERAEIAYAKRFRAPAEGEPALFFARTDTGDAVGMAALLPFSLSVDGADVAGAIAANLVVAPGHRGPWGPGLALHRRTIQHFESSTLGFLYARPNEQAEPLYRHGGYVEVGSFRRYVRPLRARFLTDVAGWSPGIARRLGPLVDPVLGRLSIPRARRGWRAGPVAAFDDSFVPLWRRMARERAVTGSRDAAVLNWRYELPAGGRFRLLALFGANDEPAAYTVYEDRDGVRHLIDLAHSDRGALSPLLGAVVRDARCRGAQAVAVMFLGADPALRRALRLHGFVEHRERRPLFVCPAPGSPLERHLDHPERWFLVHGDVDL